MNFKRTLNNTKLSELLFEKNLNEFVQVLFFLSFHLFIMISNVLKAFIIFAEKLMNFESIRLLDLEKQTVLNNHREKI